MRDMGRFYKSPINRQKHVSRWHRQSNSLKTNKILETLQEPSERCKRSRDCRIRFGVITWWNNCIDKVFDPEMRWPTEWRFFFVSEPVVTIQLAARWLHAAHLSDITIMRCVKLPSARLQCFVPIMNEDETLNMTTRCIVFSSSCMEPSVILIQIKRYKICASKLKQTRWLRLIWMVFNSRYH